MKPNENVPILTKTDSEVSSLSQSSPPRSPRRPVYCVQSPSCESASTRFSGSRKSSSTNRKGPWRPWKDHFHAIEEEGLLDAHDNAQHGFPRRCYFPAFIFAFLLLFSFFSLIL
ncbi:uncharacterized protein LOC124838093 [Vigna umbellata]|uniref:uncharacterized protein LOC124838093 n=1 Tax=Vigna umbellata TaxID=87088 RepID=UPI001F5EDAA8|nr:uncharacterized protein LOC124838093 [Vigna umbellata]